MKKILVLAAVLAFSVVAIGCGGSSAGTNATKPKEVPGVGTVPTPAGK